MQEAAAQIRTGRRRKAKARVGLLAELVSSGGAVSGNMTHSDEDDTEASVRAALVRVTADYRSARRGSHSQP